MMSSPGALRALNIVSGLLLVAAAVLYFLPVRANVEEITALPPLPMLADRPVMMPNESDAATIVAQNILSGSRKTPSVRYVSPDIAGAAEYSMPSAFAPSVASEASRGDADATDGVPTLYGIVNSDGAWRALLRLDENDPTPVLMREGDRRGSYRVVTIRQKEVVVAGPSGQRTLRLARIRSDSTGKPQ